MTSQYSVSEAQKSLSRLLQDSAKAPIRIERHEKTAAYVVSAERFESLVETLEILSNPRAMAAIRAKGPYVGTTGRASSEFAEERSLVYTLIQTELDAG
jgi:antitoxin StbD